MERACLYDLYGQVLGANLMKKKTKLLAEKRADLHEEEEF